jgi:hypothetical protein
MGDAAPPASPSVSFGEQVITSDGSAAVDSTSNPMDLTLMEDPSPTSSADRQLDPLRSSILKPGEGPVVSPRNPLTRNLSFVDQTPDAKPLKEVRLYERDPRPGQPGRPGSLLGPPEEEEEEETVKPIMIAFGVVVLLVRLESHPPDDATAACHLPLLVLVCWCCGAVCRHIFLKTRLALRCSDAAPNLIVRTVVLPCRFSFGCSRATRVDSARAYS